jgi:hypothetical protein
MLTVNGTNFVAGAVVNFNGKAEPTTFLSASQLTAAVPAADNATGGSMPVTVTNPAPGGGTSAGVNFTADSFTESVPSKTATVSAGQPAQFTIMIASSTNGFSNTVMLSATGLPQGSTATFNPNPAASGAIVTMTVATTAHNSLVLNRRGPGGLLRIQPEITAAIALALVMGILLLLQRDRRGSAMAGAVLLLCLFISSCSSSGSVGTPPSGISGGTPAGTYNITVTATSGTLVQTTQLTLTVN